MTEEEILELIKKGVGQNLELVKEIPSSEKEKKEFAKIMTAFANSGDGIILIGVERNLRSVTGINRNYDITKEIMDIDKKYCSPAICPQISAQRIGTNQLGIVGVRRGDERPYCVEGDCYIRADKQVFIASHGELEGMYKKRKSPKKEGSDSWPVELAAYEDLDQTKIDEYLNNIGIKIADESSGVREKTLKDKGMLVEIDGKLRPTAAALLMFGKDPQYFLTYSTIRLVKFQGKNIGSVIVDQKEVKGIIPEMIEEAWKFLLNHMNTGSKIEGLTRNDFTQYPQAALREAITNAVVHRDYGAEGSQVRIFMFDDRIEIYTPGGLPDGVSVSNMEYTQYSRNKIITDILMHTGKYIEKLGAGIRRIKLSVKESGLRAPIFFDSGVDFILTLFGPVESSRQVSKQELTERIQKVIGPAKSPQEMTALTKENAQPTTVPGQKINLASLAQAFSSKVKKSKNNIIKAAVAGIILLVLSVFIIVSWSNARSPLVQYHRAAVLHNQGRYSEAIDAYARFLKNFPDNEKTSDAQYYMAGCLDVLGEDISALNAYADLLKKYPKSRWAPYAYYWRGAIYLDLGEFDNALAQYQQVIDSYPDHPIVLSAMRDSATCLFKRGKFQDAIDAYERILDLTEASNEGYEYYQMGLCYLELGQKDKAKEIFAKVVAGDKMSPQLVKDAKNQLDKLGR